jgi:hypothetical protein
MRVSVLFFPTVLCLAYPFCSNLFILVDIADTVKELNQSISNVLDEIGSWRVKSRPAQKTVPDSPSASRCRAKMRFLEDQLNTWRCGIGQGKASSQWSTGESSVVSEELPSLVDCDEADESDHSRSQRGGGLEVHYESTAAENDVEAPIIVGRRKDRHNSMSSVPLETSLYRPEESCEAAPNAFRSKEANEIELPTVPTAEFAPIPGTDLEMPEADYLEAGSPISIAAHQRASTGYVSEEYDKPPPQVRIGKWHAGRRSSIGSIPSPIESDQRMGHRRSLGTMNGGLASPRSVGKRRPSLGSGKVDIIVGRRPSGVIGDESYSSAGTDKHGGSVVSRRESVGSITGLLVREGSRSSVSTELNSCDASRASVGTGFQSSGASRASVGSGVSPKSVLYLRDASRSNAGKTHHAPIGSPRSVPGSIDSRKGFNDSYSTILTVDSSLYRGSNAQHTPIGSPGSVNGSIGSRKNANEGCHERKGSCTSEGKGINAPLGSPGSVAGCIDSQMGADGSRRQRSHRKLAIGESSKAPLRTPSIDQASPSTPRFTKKRHGSRSSPRKEGSKRDLLSKDRDAESSPRSLRCGKNYCSRSGHGSESGTDPDTPRSSRRKHSSSERKESMISEVEAILYGADSTRHRSSRSDSTRHRSSRTLDSKESREPTTPRSQRKERLVSLSSPRRSSRRSSMGAGGSSAYYSEVEADQLRGLTSRRQEPSHRASMGSLTDGNVEEMRHRQSRRSSVGSIATDSVEEMQRRQSRRASIPADKAQEKHRRQGRSAVTDGEAPAATPRSNLDSSLSKLDMEQDNCQLGGATKKSQHSVGSLGA